MILYTILRFFKRNSFCKFMYLQKSKALKFYEITYWVFLINRIRYIVKCFLNYSQNFIININI